MQSKAVVNDRDLIQQYIDGDDRAFSILLERHKDRIYTSIYFFVKDEDLANDIFQETFIKIINVLRRGDYNHEGKFLQWALRIAHNKCIDNHRKNKRNPIQPNNSDEYDIFDFINDSNPNAEKSIIRSQLHIQVRKLIDMLPPEQREVVVLRHYAELSFKEIADLSRISINTALGRMRYALINIRKMIDENKLQLY